MLLKWLFTLLAIIWLYQALRPMLLGFYRPPQPPRQPPPPPPTPGPETRIVQKSRFEDEGEYIDYEELK